MIFLCDGAVATGAAADRSRIRMTELEEEVQELQQRNKDLRSEIKMKEEKYDNERERVHELRTQLAATEPERRELHEMVMTLRGSIRVHCRVRPPVSTSS